MRRTFNLGQLPAAWGPISALCRTMAQNPWQDTISSSSILCVRRIVFLLMRNMGQRIVGAAVPGFSMLRKQSGITLDCRFLVVSMQARYESSR